MARPNLLNVAGFTQYITQLGINRQIVFLEKEDYEFYLECLCDSSEKWYCLVHAYCLLPDKIHLLITPNYELNIPRSMQSINRRYVLHIYEKYDRQGTLWNGRYSSSLVENRYILDCYRHIDSLPYETKNVQSANDYLWSSYQYHANNMHSYLIQKP